MNEFNLLFLFGRRVDYSLENLYKIFIFFELLFLCIYKLIL